MEPVKEIDLRLEKALSLNEEECLRALLTELRTDPVPKMRALIQRMDGDSDFSKQLTATFRRLLGKSRLVHALAESGIVTDQGLGHTIRVWLGEAILPRVLPDDDVRLVIREVCSGDDWRWITEVPAPLLEEFIDHLVTDEDAEGIPHKDVAAAILGLAQRAGSLGIDEEVYARLRNVEDYNSPFLDLTPKARAFLEDNAEGFGSDESFQALMDDVNECRAQVEYLRNHRKELGTTMRLTAVTRRLLQQLRRLEILAHLVRPRDKQDFVKSVVPVLKEVVEAELTGWSLRRVLNEHADLLAYQITEQTAKKGQKYITDTVKGYWKFLRKAIAGGGIVAVFAILKTIMSKWDIPMAAEAVLYSLNYALCFVLIYLTGSILATKQPAVTASSIARRMDEAATDEDAVEGVADMVVLVWRSQFISFVGNLICAFPVAMVLTWLLGWGLGYEVADAAKAQKLLAEIHPWTSGALFYAGVAGVFLFSAGVISGWVDNHVAYMDMGARIRNLKSLRFFGSAERVAKFVTDNVGMLSGNIALGFFLGTAGTLGIFFGLPFDIRHIAFSSAHFGAAVFSAPEILTWQLLAVSAAGVAAIGFVNFVVSFGMTLAVTLESRQALFGQWRQLFGALLKRFFTRPWAWVYPPRDTAAKAPEKDKTAVEAQ